MLIDSKVLGLQSLQAHTQDYNHSAPYKMSFLAPPIGELLGLEVTRAFGSRTERLIQESGQYIYNVC